MEKPSFARLQAAWRWRPIPNCPGRFVMEGGVSDTPPQDLLDAGIEIVECRSPVARDRIFISRFEGGGLISYANADGRYIHTLNTSEGLTRKLAALGLAHESPIRT